MEENGIQIKLKKQAQKYLDSVDERTRRKLYRALDQLSRWEGDIVRLAGTENCYRYKKSRTTAYCLHGKREI